jgi:uncharacterized protein (TIGR02266 family)
MTSLTSGSNVGRMEEQSRRAYPRVNTDISVNIKAAGRPAIVSGVIRNISLGGIFVQLADPLAFGTDVDLEFRLPALAKSFRCKGVVIWSSRQSPEKAPDGVVGMGLRLRDISVRDMRELADYINVKTEDHSA